MTSGFSSATILLIDSSLKTTLAVKPLALAFSNRLHIAQPSGAYSAQLSCSQCSSPFIAVSFVFSYEVPKTCLSRVILRGVLLSEQSEQ